MPNRNGIDIICFMRNDFSSPITIRLCHDDEIQDALDVLKTAFKTVRSVYRPSEKIAAGQTERAKEGMRLVAIVDQQMVATVQIANHQHHAHLIGLAVPPDYRKQGIARRLIQKAREITRVMGHNTLVLETIKETGNAPVFEKLGFHVCGERVTEDFVSDQFKKLHEVRMEMKLG